jgi:hypothetical protein
MSRLSRKTMIHAVNEVTYGVNPGGWSSGKAILVANPRIRIARDVVPRELVRDYLGGSDHLIGTRRAEIEFDVEIAGSGAAGTPPPYGPLLRACGLAETITAASHVRYTPISENFESGAIRYVVDGVMYYSSGCRGSVKLDLTAYQRPMMKFRFMGYDSWAVAHDGVNTDFTAWQRPQVITEANSGDIRLGGTQAAGGGVTGGAVLVSRGLEIDLGNTLSHIKLLRGEAIDITQRDAMGKMSVALSAADEVTWRTDITNNVVTSLGFNHGSEAGNKVVIFAPRVQRIDPQAENYEGRHLMSSELRLLPNAGDDELAIIIK